MTTAMTRQHLEQQALRVPGASQATNIEQSRAIAEVQAAVTVAQRFPRNEGQAMTAVIDACGQIAMAERAFYSFPRGRESVNGPSIALAVELARCWGNIDYGIMELNRDDEAGHTEMLAFAWDLQTNTKSRQTFIVPHSRDTRQGRKALTDMRDIYENNANNGARRLRECIFRVLPVYLREAAERECRKVLERGEGNVPLAERISRAVRSFAELGVSLDRLEARQGASANWTPVDLANLHILHTSLRNRETTIDEAFPRDSSGDSANLVKALAQQGGKPDQSDDLPPLTERDIGRHDDELDRLVQSDDVQDAEVEDIAEPDQAAEAQQALTDIDGPLDLAEDEAPIDPFSPDAPWAAKVAEIKAAMDKAETVIDLKAVPDRFAADLEVMPQEVRDMLARQANALKEALKDRAGRGSA